MSQTRSTITFPTVMLGVAALVVGTAGTAYAANEWTGKNIVNGSLTGKDIKAESLKSGDILDGTITGQDVSDGSLTGADIQTESIGTTQVQDFGLSNQDVGVLFAQINADGSVANSSGGVTATKLGGSGSYEVNFGRDVSQCAFTATIGPSGGGSALGELNVADRAGNVNAVFVDTNDSAGAAQDRPFNLIVVC